MGIEHPGLERIIEALEAQRDVTVAGLGDSLTFGWMVSQGYFDRFCDVLQRRYAGAVLGRINAGVPGDTVRGGLRRLGAVLERDPDVVVVQFGINDMACGVDEKAFEEDLDAVTARISGSGAVPQLVTSCPLLGSDRARIGPYYEAVRRVARARAAALADIELYWRDKARFAAGSESWHLGDGVHPSDEGHELMAECLLTSFSRDTWLSPPPV